MVSVLRDDVSRYGLRRWHGLRSKGEGWPEVVDGAGEEVFRLEWADEVGLEHLYLAWRAMMGVEMVIANGVFGEAAQEAAAGFVRRFERMPNRMLVREGVQQAPAEVDLVAEGGETVRAQVMRVTWLRDGDVGACYMEVD